MRRLQLSIATLLTFVAAPAAAPAAPTTIAGLHGQSPVRAFAAVQTWTDFSIVARRWHVFVRRGGTISAPPAIAPGDGRLKVDVGPGPGAKPMLAYIDCANSCRVVLSDLDGANARAVPGSQHATSVSVDGSRVAWVRGRNSVRVRDLKANSTVAVAGAPRRKCWTPFRQVIPGKGRVTPPPRCETTTGASVDDVELDGSRLALIVSYQLAHGGGSNGTTEVRVESVRGGAQRLIALMNVGEGQQTWIGPSWVGHDLFFYRSCPFACPRQEGAYRYDPDRRIYAYAPASIAISGFAMDSDAVHAFEVLGLFGGREDSAGEIENPLQRSGRLSFHRTRPPIAGLG
ncbi:MAG: hypothetical protein QOE31_3192 [Solirubrobacteraceae bacterium]|nr:hypothetical protein [Solirubrobacteraceae bacterium]